MRTLSTEEQQIIDSPTRRVDIRVKIEDGDATLQDMTDFFGNDWLLSVDFGEDIDSDGMDARIVLARELHHDSTAPTVRDARTNLNGGGSWDPILDLGREVVIEVRIAADETATANSWHEMFRGAIDIIDWGSYEVQITCRDQIRDLQDTFIEDRDEYSLSGGQAIETTMQDIMDDWLSSPPTLYTPSTPAFVTTNYNVSKESVLSACKFLADMIGWRVKYKWDSGTSAFRLTLFEPDRTKSSVDYTFTDDDYYEINRMAVDIKDIRNAVTIYYPDPTDLLQDGQPTMKSVTRTDSASITSYGRRWMGITEESTSLIDTSTEANDLADIAISDLAFPKIDKEMIMPLWAWVELEDLYDVTANEYHSSTTITYAVVGYRHTFSDNRAETSLLLREDAVAGKHITWFELSASPGSAQEQEDRTFDMINASTTSLNGSNMIYITWETAVSHDGPGLIPTHFPHPIEYNIYATLPGEIPTDQDLVLRTRSTSAVLSPSDNNAIPIDTDLDIHIEAETIYGVGTKALIEDVKAKPLGSAHLDMTAQPYTDGYSNNFNEISRGTLEAPDNWDISVGTWNTDALLDDGTDYTTVLPIYGERHLVLK